MPYTINRTDGTQLFVLPDQTTDTAATSLNLVGRGSLNFGETVTENFIALLENFARNTPPRAPMVGQMWYDKGTSKMKMWDGTAWKRFHLGTDDVNAVPGITFGAGLTVTGSTVTANMISVAGRTGTVVLGVGDVSGAAPLASPVLTGTPAAPTAATGTNTTQVATTAFVRAQIAASSINNVTTDNIGDGLINNAGTIAVLSQDSNRLVVTNGGINISNTYAGQASINTLGTITTGTWNGTPIGLAYGGTGAATKELARQNLSAMEHNNLAHSLKDAGTGILVNAGGTAVARQIVSGTPDKIVINNPTGENGNITISITGDTNSGPVPISGGGTGASTKASAFNALSPASTAGDLIYYGSGGAHLRLAGNTGAAPVYLESGANSAIPRWTANVNAATLGGYNLAYVLSRANHTGEIDASKLGGQLPAHYLNYANMTGTPAAGIIFSSTNLSTGGSVVFRGGFQMVWSTVTIQANRVTLFTYPLAFPNACFGATCSGGASADEAQDNNPHVSAVNPTQVAIYNALDSSATVFYFAYGY